MGGQPVAIRLMHITFAVKNTVTSVELVKYMADHSRLLRSSVE